jgi:hypothetical protein
VERVAAFEHDIAILCVNWRNIAITLIDLLSSAPFGQFYSV